MAGCDHLSRISRARHALSDQQRVQSLQAERYRNGRVRIWRARQHLPLEAGVETVPPSFPQSAVPRPTPRGTLETSPFPILRDLSRPRLAALRLAAHRRGGGRGDGAKMAENGFSFSYTSCRYVPASGLLTTSQKPRASRCGSTRISPPLSIAPAGTQSLDIGTGDYIPDS
jgi:hypothetical protein